MRSGLWTSGSGGSGVLLARKTDGSWSPPSALMLQSHGLGFGFGVDIYDCVLVINNFSVLETFARQKFTLGTDVGLTAGPLVSLGLLENDLRWADLSDAVITYVKAKGHMADIKLDGTVLSERADENERFYGMKIGVPKILAGDINQSLPQTRTLTEMLKVAEGRTDYDAALIEQLSAQPAPGDATIESPASPHDAPIFGIPDVDDPDPFGVVALEMAGLEIREAGSRLRPESSQFDYVPSPSSPIFPRLSRRSVDTFVSRSNRGSYMSNKTMATERSQMTDAGTQTFGSTPETTPSQSEDGNPRHQSEDVPEVKEPEEIDYTKVDISALKKLTNFPDLEEEPTETPVKRIATVEEKDEDAESKHNAEGAEDKATDTDMPPVAQKADVSSGDDSSQDEDDVDDADDEDDEDDFEDAEEEAVVFEVATAQTPQRSARVVSQGLQAKGAVVTIPRRVPPPLPTRSPARGSWRKSQLAGDSMVSSPLRQEFDMDLGQQEILTPRPQDVVTNEHMDKSTGDITVIQDDREESVATELKKTESEAKPELETAEYPPAPFVDSDETNTAPQAEELTSKPKRSSTVVRASLDKGEQENLASSSGMQVSVA